MEFTLEFVRMFAVGLFYAVPLLIFLLLIIAILGHLIGKLEGWSTLDAQYHAFIAATTVGYGDFHPARKRSKMLAIAIAFVGLTFTGITVGIALHAALHAFQKTHDAIAITKELGK